MEKNGEKTAREAKGHRLQLQQVPQTLQRVRKTIAMCRPATCDNCKKTSWVGCGLHIPAAMDPVPKDERCTCAHPADSATSKDYPPKVGTGIPPN